jgi:hypothetical protein
MALACLPLKFPPGWWECKHFVLFKPVVDDTFVFNVELVVFFYELDLPRGEPFRLRFNFYEYVDPDWEAGQVIRRDNLHKVVPSI